jgi:hypothetical protein
VCETTLSCGNFRETEHFEGKHTVKGVNSHFSKLQNYRILQKLASWQPSIEKGQFSFFPVSERFANQIGAIKKNVSKK